MELEDPLVKDGPEPMLLRHVPFLIDDFETNVFVRRPSLEFYDHQIQTAVSRVLEVELGCLVLAQAWVEKVEFVTLNHLGWRVVCIVVGLVVLIPLEAHPYRVVVPRLEGHALALSLEWLVCKLKLVLAKSFRF